jgi:hypothetical protein
LYGIVYNENAQQPEIEVFVYQPGFTAWETRTPLKAALQPGVGRIPTVWGGNGITPTVWSGSELIVSDGGSTVWGYDPQHDTWGELPSLLPEPATATSLTSIDGVPVAVFLSNGVLKAARLGTTGWTVVTSGDISPAIAKPLAVDAGGTLVVIDRAGKSPPVRADEATGKWEPIPGYPLTLGVNGNAVWAGDGLFVWGGLPEDTTAATPTGPPPGPPDAAWYGK